jgi:FtsP/CotA-like multicopper oxidase with cupredoxin domain
VRAAASFIGGITMANDTVGPADPGRRDLILAGAALTAGMVTREAGSAPVPVPRKALPKSPPTTPFVVRLPVYRPKLPVAALMPPPTRVPTGEECGRANHQRYADFPAHKFYQLHVKPTQHSFHPELPTQLVWGYDGMVPGPTFVAHYNEPVLVRIYNELPASHVGFASPEISTHLHNLHCASESDGYPGDYFSPSKAGPTLTAPGKYKDHLYPNCYAGYDQHPETDGDPREALGTLWYHDHRLDFTAQNVYRGLAGFYLLFDEIDSGNERDPNPKALRLPSGVGEYDIPLVIFDKQFDSGGYLAFDQFDSDGMLGDKLVVNGKVQPFFSVERRKYRFRLLNASVSRFFEFYLTYNNGSQSFTYIANDGNLLPKPLAMSKIRIAPAERADLVIDFSQYPIGTKLYVVNKLEQVNGRGPTGKILNPGTPILRFDVDAEPAVADVSRVPPQLRELPPINLSEVAAKRTWSFDRLGGNWAVNDKLFNVEQPAARPKKGTAEIWTLKGKGSWTHPVHIHFEEGRILSRNGVPPPPHEQGRKDVYVIAPEEEVRIFLRFRDYAGKYVMHCHNLVHEDHSMMIRFDIEE